MKTKRINYYGYKNMKNFSEYRTSEMITKNIISILMLTDNVRLIETIIQLKVRKMYLFGLAHALYLEDKIKNKKDIERILESATTLDLMGLEEIKLISNMKVKKK
jgi:hypothetical protein